MAEKVLVIDDDPTLLELIEATLEQDNYKVFVASNGEDGLRRLGEIRPHLIILDIMMPSMDGWEICGHVRKFSTVPIIILTALNSHEDIVRGLNAGADDYLVKPFYQDELLARVSAVLRRANMPRPSARSPLRFGNGNLIIDPANRQVILYGQLIELTPTEFDLLLFMAHHPGRIMSAEFIFEHVWSYDSDADLDSVKWYMWRLRKKIEERPGNPRYIITERGVGYRFLPNYGQVEKERVPVN